MEKYFENVCNVGDLNLEKVFMKFEDENILFICKDSKGDRFLGVCYELRYTLKWVLCRVKKESLLQMLVDNITVHECFRKADEVLLISYSQEMGEKSEWTTYEKIEKRILPDEDFYLKYDMKKDVYYLNIIYEMFREQKNAETFMEINAESFMQKKRMMQTEHISKNAFVVRKKRTHEVIEQNANKEWVGYCA